MTTDSELIEMLAEQEHDQWMSWSSDIVRTEDISPDRLRRWKNMWKPYCELTIEQKKQDRVWAMKTLNMLKALDLLKR